MTCKFIAEVSSNHNASFARCIQSIDEASKAGFDAVKFQLFKVEELFCDEVLRSSPDHLARKKWELNPEFIPDLAAHARSLNLEFGCTPFYLEAVDLISPYVDFIKVASYELLWLELITRCAETNLPLILSTGMASLDEVDAAVEAFKGSGNGNLTLLHCVSVYPAEPESLNLSAIGELRNRFGCDIGWSDHTRNPFVIYRAVDRWKASHVEMHIDIDGNGSEYSAGHCYLASEAGNVINALKYRSIIDGSGIKEPSESEAIERLWRACPSDGKRPLRQIRSDIE